MSSLDAFSDILQRDQSLAPYTWLKVGGPAQFFLTPRSEAELQSVVKACHAEGIPVRLLGSGSNLIVRDEGVGGAVIRLSDPAFAVVTVSGSVVKAGAGALLSHVISESVRAGLAGLETLAGIPGTIGGAIVGNAGGRHGEIGPLVTAVTVLNPDGTLTRRSAEELAFSYRSSNLTDQMIIAVELALTPDDPAQITQRLRKIWITKKASQPLNQQSAGCIFRNPRGVRAGELIEQAGLKGTRVGGAEVNDRHANFIVTHAGATSADVMRLMDLVKTKVAGQFGVHLEPEVRIW